MRLMRLASLLATISSRFPLSAVGGSGREDRAAYVALEQRPYGRTSGESIEHQRWLQPVTPDDLRRSLAAQQPGARQVVNAATNRNQRLHQVGECVGARQHHPLVVSLAEAVAVAKLLKSRYPALAKELVALIERLDAAERQVAAVNEKLAVAGRAGERLAEVEWRAWPAPEGQFAPQYSIRNRTKLRELPGLAPGYFDDPEVWPARATVGPIKNPNFRGLYNGLSN